MSMLKKSEIKIDIMTQDPFYESSTAKNIDWSDIEELIKCGNYHFTVAEQNIPKEAIKGFVLSPNTGQLERKIGAIDKNEQKKIMDISHDQAAQLLTKRMDRQMKLHPESAHFVPLYDYNGDILWPKTVNKIG